MYIESVLVCAGGGVGVGVGVRGQNIGDTVRVVEG